MTSRIAGFTLVELLIVVAILSLIAGLVVPSYLSSVRHARNVKAIAEIRQIQTDIESYRSRHGSLPLTLADAGLLHCTDPWGRPYEYLNFDTVKGKGKYRKDKNLVPINTEFDLYSKGADGESTAPLTAANSWDDVIFANDGAFIDLAHKY